jgi:hypothetical protein
VNWLLAHWWYVSAWLVIGVAGVIVATGGRRHTRRMEEEDL